MGLKRRANWERPLSTRQSHSHLTVNSTGVDPFRILAPADPEMELMRHVSESETTYQVPRCICSAGLYASRRLFAQPSFALTSSLKFDQQAACGRLGEPLQHAD